MPWSVLWNQVKTGLCTRARTISRCFVCRVKTVYEDECMKLETHYNQIRSVVVDLTHWIIAAGLAKLANPSQQAQLQPLSRNVQEIEVVANPSPPTRSAVEWNHQCTLQDPRVHCSDLDAWSQQRRRIRRSVRRPSTQNFSHSRTRRVPVCVTQVVEPTPEPSYLSTLPPLDPRESFSERQQSIRASLTYIVGAERMKLGVGLPSGHSGIDPVIAEYHHQKALTEFWERVESGKRAEQAHAHAERVREERQRVECEILLEWARRRYVERVELLAQFGSMLAHSMELLHCLFGNGNDAEFDFVVESTIDEICNPVRIIHDKMEEEIALEEEGAQILQETWPMQQLESMMLFLQSQEWPAESWVRLGRALKAICHPILNPTPFRHPLDPTRQDPAPEGTSVQAFQPVVVERMKTIVSLPAAPSPVIAAAAAVAVARAKSPPPVEESAPCPTDLGHPTNLKEVYKEKTLESSSSLAGGRRFSGALNPCLSSSDRQALLQFCSTNQLDLQFEVSSLLNKEGKIDPLACRSVFDILSRLLPLAKGQTSVLGPADEAGFVDVVKQAKMKADSVLKSNKKSRRATTLNSMIKDVLSIWA